MIIECVFVGADMRQGHDGMMKHASKKGVNLKNLKDQHAVCFFSRDRYRMKLFTFNGIVCYLRRTELQRPFDLNAVDEFHRAFDKNGKLDYDKALKFRLEKFMAQRGKSAEKQSKQFSRL